MKKAAVVYSSLPATIDTTEKVLGTYTSQGFTFLDDCTQTYAIQGEPDWKPFVQRLKDCGAEMVYFSGSPSPYFENLLDAAHQLDFEPIWFTEANFVTPGSRIGTSPATPTTSTRRCCSRPSSRPTSTRPPSSTSTS